MVREGSILALVSVIAVGCGPTHPSPTSSLQGERGPGRDASNVPSAQPSATAAPHGSGEPATSSKPVAAAESTTKGPEMRFISGGRFMMGWASSSLSAPVHAVTVASFWIDETEVTVSQYASCVAVKACTEPLTYSRRGWNNALTWGRPGREQHPVNGVDWRQAQAFCKWANKQLPTEEQWEFAARGTSSREYPWGNEPLDPTRLNAAETDAVQWAKRVLGQHWRPIFDASDGWPVTAPVGSFPRGNTPEGVSDLAGNVWEWTESKFCPYSRTGRTDCPTELRTMRGGDWSSESAAFLRGAARHTNTVERLDAVGIRCVRAP